MHLSSDPADQPAFVALEHGEMSSIINRLVSGVAFGIYMRWVVLYLANPFALKDDRDFLYAISGVSKRLFNLHYETVRAEFKRSREGVFLESRYWDKKIIKAKTMIKNKTEALARSEEARLRGEK